MAESKLAHITFMAREALKLERQITETEGLLDRLKGDHRALVERDIPTAMDEADLTDFSLGNGWSVTVVADLAVGIKKENVPLAHTWLRKHGHGALIKREMTVKFGKGEEAAAKACLKLLKPYHPADKESVHYQTLKAFVREELTKGTALPMDLFGVVPLRRASLVPPAPQAVEPSPAPAPSSKRKGARAS